jgi:hypothetical protein
MADDQKYPNLDEFDFQKSTLLKLYSTNSGNINHVRWERVRQDIRFEDVVAETVGLSGGNSISCPFHGRDSTPSFWLYKGTNDGWCFGCLSVREPIWTLDGLTPIGVVPVGATVFDRHGNPQIVLCKEYKEGKLLAIETENFRDDPLLLTPDHTCLYVRAADARNHLPYIVSRKGRLSFFGGYKRARKPRTRVSMTPVTEGSAEQMREGDYLLFPVISQRNLESLSNVGTNRNYIKGTVPAPVSHLPVEGSALYGLYLAEGSTNPTDNPRSVRWTFHIDEANTMGKLVADLLHKVFNLNSTLTLYPEKTTCEVVCSSVELARGLSFWFGAGAENKKLPAQVLSWPVKFQQELLDGYSEGDGDSKGRAETVSPLLAYSLFALGIQAGRLMSVGSSPAYTDKRGVFHQKSWSTYAKKRESLKGFYQGIKGTLYYWSRISKVEDTGRVERVVDITVSGTESFLTKLAAVHNCPPGEQYYDHVRFVSKYLNISRIAALKWIEKKFELEPLAEFEDLEEGDEEITVTLEMKDLTEPYIIKSVRDVQSTQDVGLALEYLRFYFEAIHLDKAADELKKQGDEPEEVKDLQLKAAMILARILGKTEIDKVLERKVR